VRIFDTWSSINHKAWQAIGMIGIAGLALGLWLLVIAGAVALARSL
jgi:hypothetical protein